MTETQKAEKDKINKMHDSVTKGIIRGGRREDRQSQTKMEEKKGREHFVALPKADL